MRLSRINLAIENLLDTIMTSFVDNHKDLGELLVDKTGDYLSDDIKKLLSDTHVVIEDAILSILGQLAADSLDEILDIPSCDNALEDNS